MLRFERTCEGLAQTRALAADLAAVLRTGDVVRLEGELGAGKTTLVRMVVEAMGIDPAIVSSPTFVLANDYPPPAEERPGVAHLDCYRMGGPDELDTIGWDRITDDRIVLIEWAERIAEALPADAALIALAHAGEHDRDVRIEVPEAWAERVGFAGLGDPPAARVETICPITGLPVPADSPTWPFAGRREQLADLHGWFAEKHVITRPIDQRDLEEGVD